MTDPCAPILYQQQYEEAVRLFDQGDFEACIALAKYNVTDETLPPYYLIKNVILIASAMDDWVDADIWRLTAEQAYITARDKATKIHDEKSLKALPELREELDQMIEFRVQDIQAFKMSIFPADEDDGEGEGEVEEEGVDETIVLPLHPPREKTHKAKKGGAYHMHSFTKSLGKGTGSGSVRASILGMDWEANKGGVKSAKGAGSPPGQ